jgi:hypothetical protein
MIPEPALHRFGLIAGCHVWWRPGLLSAHRPGEGRHAPQEHAPRGVWLRHGPLELTDYSAPLCLASQPGRRARTVVQLPFPE